MANKRLSVGQKISRAVNRILTGRNETLSLSIATSAKPLSGALRRAWPSHFMESLEAHKMKREPGPLTEEDTREIEMFQAANDCEVDGIIGHQTQGAIWAKLGRSQTDPFWEPSPFSWW